MIKTKTDVVTRQRILILDLLRGFFSILVITYHYPAELIPDSMIKKHLFSQSWVFVDFFFVLSGYVISFNYDNENFNLKRFIIKRFARIYPLLFYSVIAFLGVQLIFYFLTDKFCVNTLLGLLSQTFETLFLLNSHNILGGGVGMNYPSWSISAEFISYFIFAIILKFLFKRRQICFFLLIITSLLFLIYEFGHNGIKTEGDFGFVRCIHGFFLGSLLSRFSFYKYTFGSQKWHVVIISLLGLFILYLLDSFPFVSFILPIFFTLSIAMVINFFMFKNARYSSIMSFFGEISYSVYLNHAIVVLVWTKVFQYAGLYGIHQFIDYGLFLFIIVVTIIYSFFTRQYIEVYMENKILSFVTKRLKWI